MVTTAAVFNSLNILRNVSVADPKRGGREGVADPSILKRRLRT
jgi:hypothetical protein